MCIREGERISQWAAGGGQQILKSPVTTGYQTHPVFSSFDCQVVTRPLKDVCKVLLLYSLAHIWGLSLLPLRLLIPGSRHLTFSPDPSPRLPKGALLSLVTGHSLFFFFFGKFSNFLFVNDFSALCRCPFPPPEDLPDPGIEPRSSALQADSLQSEPPGEAHHACCLQLIQG